MNLRSMGWAVSISVALMGCGGDATNGTDASVQADASLESLCATSCRRSSDACPEIQRDPYRTLCTDTCVNSLRDFPAVCRGLLDANMRCVDRAPAVCGEPLEPICPAESCALNACIAAEQVRQGIEPNFRGTCDGGA
ncbi:MAG: hypothetical protein R3A52_02185 [Polyangiales bacterium]